jgi:hypothetical protein
VQPQVDGSKPRRGKPALSRSHLAWRQPQRCNLDCDITTRFDAGDIREGPSEHGATGI